MFGSYFVTTFGSYFVTTFGCPKDSIKGGFGSTFRLLMDFREAKIERLSV
jgi:hypothetical protein